jgi:hypothetical protein
MDFPRLVYRSAAVHCAANTEEELDLLLRDGWFASVPEAMAKESATAPIDESAPAARHEPEAKANEPVGKIEEQKPGNKISVMIEEGLKKWAGRSANS